MAGGSSGSQGGATAFSLKEKHEQVFQRFKWPSVLFGVGGGVYMGMLPGEWKWFSWHPLSMMIACVPLVTWAILVKKIGGLENTKLHMFLFQSAAWVMLFGGYVIYSNKETYGKPHYQTYHSWMGMAVIVTFTLIAMAMPFALHPEIGYMRTNTTVRSLHKFFGKVYVALAWVTCITGFMTIQSDPLQQVFLSLSFACFAYHVLQEYKS